MSGEPRTRPAPPLPDAPSGRRPGRLLVVMPSWVGDCVMATPSLRVLRELLPGTFIGALLRPGLDQLLAGTTFFDAIHVDRAAGMMGPRRVAGRIRRFRFDTAILFTNSFSTALITRLAGIPWRLGYVRDGRGMLITDPLQAPRRRDVDPYRQSRTNPGGWAPVPACRYYYRLASHLLADAGLSPGTMGPLELVVTREEELLAEDLLVRARVTRGELSLRATAVLNPGGNDEAKRWPVDRYAALADYLAEHHDVRVLINGSPAERELTAAVAAACRPDTRPILLADHGINLSILKAIIARSAVMVTNDTGPRHIAAAVGTPLVTLFGPTDPRWTTIPFEDEIIRVADPTLPREEVADDHPERCRIDRIGLGDVVASVNELLTRRRVISE
ncbi:MAG: glycosyltransferase family 9 protein [Phycisphaerales bacterium]|nr:glycosyltransferase family 9 protein [Phycisphaerales bacterium]